MWKFLIIRSLIMTSAIYLCNFSFSIISITAFSILINMAPFFTTVIAYFFLNETISLFEIIAMICSFGGVTLIAFANPAEDQPTGTIFADMNERSRYVLGVAAAVVMSFLFSVMMVMTKFLKDVHPSVLFFYEQVSDMFFALLAVAIWSLCNIGKEGEVNRPLSFTDSWPYFEYMASGVLNVFSNMFMIISLQYENPALVALLVYCKCIYTFMADKLIFHATFVPL